MSPTPSSASKKRKQTKRAASTPSKQSKKSTPKSSNAKKPTPKKTTSTPTRNSKSTPTSSGRSGNKRKQPFKLIVTRTATKSQTERKPLLRVTRKNSKKVTLVNLTKQRFRISIRKRVKVISQHSKSNSPTPDFDTSVLKTPPPKPKQPHPDRSFNKIDELMSIDLETLKKKEEESISQIHHEMTLDKIEPEIILEDTNLSIINLDHSMVEYHSRILSPTKAAGAVPYTSFSKPENSRTLEDLEHDIENYTPVQEEPLGDIESSNAANDLSLPNPNIQNMDNNSPTLQRAKLLSSRPLNQNNPSSQLESENNNSFAGFDNFFEEISLEQTSTNFIDEPVVSNGFDMSFDNDNFIIGNDSQISLNSNIPNSNQDPLELDADIESTNDLKPDFDQHQESNNESNNNDKVDSSLTHQTTDAPLDHSTHNHIPSTTSDNNDQSTNLFTATGFSNAPIQPDTPPRVNNLSHSDTNSFSQSPNISSSRKFSVLSSDEKENSESETEELEIGGKRKQSILSDPSEDEELKEEMDFLTDQVILDKRTRYKQKKSKTSMLIEKMKNRNSRINESDSESSNSDESSENEYPIIILSDGEQTANDDLSDFIVEGDDNEENPELADISNLSMHSFSIEDCFMIVIKCLVYNYYDTTFLNNVYSSPIEGAYYINAFKQVDRRIESYKFSLIQSSVWNQKFLNHMSEFPYNYSSEIQSDTNCQACNRDGHFATYQLQLIGQKYNRETLEDEADEDSYLDYYLGRFCFKRTEIYHKLHHYKYHLKVKVGNSIKQLSLPDNPEPENVFSRLQANGHISKWYNEIEEIIDLANHAFSNEKY